jgi:hypothetical protein
LLWLLLVPTYWYLTGQRSELPNLSMVDLGVIFLIVAAATSTLTGYRKKALSTLAPDQLTETDKRMLQSDAQLGQFSQQMEAQGTSMLKWGFVITIIVVVIVVMLVLFLLLAARPTP